MAFFFDSVLNSILFANVPKRYFFKVCGGNIKTKKLKQNLPLNRNLDVEAQERRRKLLNETNLALAEPEQVDHLDDIPKELLKSRTARIYQPSKNAMQSGTHNIKHWVVTFDTKERWDSQNMGWCASADSNSAVCLNFATMEEAIVYCSKNGWQWTVSKKSLKKKNPRQRSYGQNFLDKRCRVTTK